MLVDTHCHIHESEFYSPEQQKTVYDNAIKNNIDMICIATSEHGSKEAIDFVKDHSNTWAVLGVHPHETSAGIAKIGELLAETHEKVVGIGEIGLDYYYMNSPPDVQIAALEQQLQWAVDYNLPVSFHVRDSKEAERSVWDDFWPIVGNFSAIRGVLHSYTDGVAHLETALERGFYIGINGICTFTKDRSQLEMFASVPLANILLETDAPFLTPAPIRGTMNEPSNVGRVAERVAILKDVSLDLVSTTTTDNARRLFTI